MSKSTLITIAIITGLLFSSCRNNSSENKQVGESDTKSTDIATQNPNDELAEKINNYITTQFMTEADLRAISEEDKKFQFYAIDLNNDGKQEVFVNFITSYFCGTGGCTVLLLNSDMELITRFSPMGTFFVGELVENGWKVLITRVEGDWTKLIYKNGTYPSNPTLIEIAMDLPENAEKIFDEDYSKQKTYSF